jgi:RecA DNA recombination protein
MANVAMARLESALRDRKLDRTLTTALPTWERRDDSAAIAIDIAALDACLRGGLPRGQLSEIVGPTSSGRTALVLQTIAASTRRGEIAALVDTFDRLDVASAAAAGIELERLLWVRGPSISLGTSIAGSLDPSTALGARSASGGHDAVVNRALKAMNLVLQAGGFGCVVLDLADVAPVALGRIPFTTWLRVQRILDGSDTACVLIAPHPLARSAGGLTLSLAGRVRWTGDADRSRHLTGADIDVHIVSPRRRVEGEVSVAVITNDSHDNEPRRHGAHGENL